MQGELDGLEPDGTFTKCGLPQGRKSIDGRWACHWKTNELGEITHAKSRLIVIGHRQEEGILYFDNFAATPNAASIRLLLATASKEGQPLSHLDTEQAFIRSDIDAETFGGLPTGCGPLF